MTQRAKRPPTHAGGVVMTRDRDDLRVLLVRASRPPHAWVLPKGQIELDERPEETARREVGEEAGVDAEVVVKLGDVTYLARGRQITVRFFVMRKVGAVTPLEIRETRWCSIPEALELLAFENVRDAVRRARSLAAGLE